MGVRTEHNGHAVEAPPAGGPPWWSVDPNLVVADLSRQLADAATEIAAMRVYIGQLHQALVTTTGRPDGPVVPTRDA